MSDNWIVQNLNSALSTWSEKMAELWTLLTENPATFKGGGIWRIMVNINDALTAIAYGLLVLFFAAGIIKTCGSFTDLKKPEHVLKAFIRFALAQGAITYGMELMQALFSIVQGIVTTVMSGSSMAGSVTELPTEIVDKIESVGMLESIPLWIVTLLGSLLITVLSFVMILTVYGRMFKIYMYTAIAPIPISSFAGEPTQSIGKNFIFNRVIQNWKEGKTTWIFADEFYLLFRYEYSANFFYRLYKRIRKYNGFVTGLTQNVEELLKSDTARLMLANSEFLILLNQASTDREELAALLNISENQLSYITNVSVGSGLIRCSGNIVPFENTFPKNTDLYKLMTTKPGES